MANRVTRKELAAAWGVSRTYIGNLVRNGRLKEDKHGTIDKAAADLVRADMSPSGVAREQEAKGQGGQRTDLHAGATPFMQARTADALFKAKHRELIVKKLTGEVVSVARVKSDAFEAARAVMAILKVMPQRNANVIASKVAGLPPKEIEKVVKEVLEAEVRRISDDFVAALERLSARKEVA